MQFWMGRAHFATLVRETLLWLDELASGGMIPAMKQLHLTFSITLAVFGVFVPGIEAQDRNLANPALATPKPAPIRCDPTERLRRLQAAGGHPNTDKAVIRGLQWLKKTQAADGSWGAKDKRPDGSSISNDKNSMTAMALLCFLGHCELQDSEEYGKTVSKAIEFLTSTPPEDRNIGVGNRGSYSHPIRTYAPVSYTHLTLPTIYSV